MKPFCIVAYSDYLSDARIMRHAEAAAGEGYAVDVITPTNPGELPKEETEHVILYRLRTRRYRGTSRAKYLASYLAFLVLCFFRLSWLCYRKRYAIIQVCNMPDFLVFSTVVAKLMGARIILDIHDPMPGTFLSKFPGSRGTGFHRLIRFQEKLSAAYADRVITVSEPVKNDILVPFGLEGHKIDVITNFPDDEIFRARDRYEVGYPIRMIYYGTIAARFDLHGVLSALAGVRHKDKMVLKIIGKGNTEVALRKVIDTLGLRSFVEWDDTVYSVRELPDIIGRYHLGLVPYLPSPATDHMLPVKLMELLAMGIPSIANTNSAIRYYIDESLYFTYNPRDLSTLTRLIEGIIDNPSLLTEKRKMILGSPRKYLWKEERGKYLDLLAQLSK